MDRIAPRRQRPELVRLSFHSYYSQLWNGFKNQWQKVSFPSNIYINARDFCHKLWHLADDISWLDPLPLGHRRALMIVGIAMLLTIIWPETSQPHMQTSPINSSLQNQGMMQASLTSSTINNNTINQVWQSYQLKQGQTLAQLFREHNLTVSDAFAIARAEGQGNPLSSLKPGTWIKIQITDKRDVSALEIKQAEGNTLKFLRQNDGNYHRVE